MTIALDDSAPQPTLAIELGAPVAPITPPSWKGIRRIAIERQRGICAGSGCGKAPTLRGQPFLDVVERDDGTGVAFCKSCRLRWDAPTRIPKAVATRAANAGRPAIAVPRNRSSQDTAPRPPDELLVTEALTLAHVEGMQTPPGEACRALLTVLREHGMLPDALPVPARRRRRKRSVPAVAAPGLFQLGPLPT